MSHAVMAGESLEPRGGVAPPIWMMNRDRQKTEYWKPYPSSFILLHLTSNDCRTQTNCARLTGIFAWELAGHHWSV